MSELMMKYRVLASFSLFHERDENVAKQTLESSIAAGLMHESSRLVTDWDMSKDITLLLARDAHRVNASLDPCDLDKNYKTESGEI